MLHFTTVKRIPIVMAAAVGLVLAIAAVSFAQPASPSATAMQSFFRSLTGEWIGTCAQSTDGQQAENKYFHAVIKQVDANTFDTKFDYYRLDQKTGAPIKIGISGMTTTIKPDGTATNNITGSGQVMVDKKPKDQKHNMSETLTASGGTISGQGKGKISVSGLPFGVGKNGKVDKSLSSWTMKNGALSISQKLKVGFKALFVKKGFSINADFTAKRGSDVVALMMKNQTVASK